MDFVSSNQRPLPGDHGDAFACTDLMAYPNATLLEFTKYGLEPTTVEQTDHYKALQEFF